MRTFFAIILAGLVSGGFAMSAAEESAAEEKIKILIFSGMNVPEIDAFYSLLENENPKIDGSFRPTNFDEADVVAYLLNSWSDADTVPGAQELPIIFEQVYKVKSPALSYSIIVELSTGRDLQFIFYSTSDAGYAPLKCYALDLAVEASRKPGEEFINNALRECMST
jgi:hypothetical protein